jgi:hypothetical protein
MDSATEQMYEIRFGLSGRGGSHVLVVLNGFGWSLDEFLKW